MTHPTTQDTLPGILLDYDRRMTEIERRLATPLQPTNELPSEPVDGQEIFFQNAAMAEAGIVWRLRYRAGSASTHKWEYVGGPPLVGESEPESETETPAAKVKFLTTSPSVTVPIAGDYDGICKALMISKVTEDFLSLFHASAASSEKPINEDERLNSQIQCVAERQYSFTGVARLLGRSASEILKLGLMTGAEKRKVTSFGRYIAIIPVRVG